MAIRVVVLRCGTFSQLLIGVAGFGGVDGLGDFLGLRPNVGLALGL
jgi:hypothetical protein